MKMDPKEKVMELSKEELAAVVSGGPIGDKCAAVTFACAVASPGVPDLEFAMFAMIF